MIIGNKPTAPLNQRFVKWVGRYDDNLRMYRICRFVWNLGDPQKPNSGKMSLSVWPKVFRFSRTWREWDLTILGVRLHRQCGGGIHV